VNSIEPGWWSDRAKEAVQALAALVGEIARLIIAIRSITVSTDAGPPTADRQGRGKQGALTTSVKI
jgi:hypothetical protein